MRSFRLGMRLKVCWRAHNSRPMVLGAPNRDHVLLDVFAEVNTCIEASRHNVEAAVVSRDIEYDVGVIVRKLGQFRSEHRGPGKSRYEKPHATHGFVA